MVIPNKYKNTLDDLIDSLNTEFLDQPDSLNWSGFIDKGSHNTLKSRGGSSTFSEKDCLDKDISIILLEPAPKIQDSQVHQRHNIAIFGAKSEKAQYGKGQRGWEDEKGKRSGKNGKGKRGKEDGKGKRSRESHWGNKVNLMVMENSSSEASVYHHIY